MKKLLLLGTVLIATTALAFGGGGSSRKSTAFTSGVDAIGVHINGKTCPDGQELVDNKCVEKCEEGVTRDRFNNCVVCTNPNEMYLPYKGGCFEVDSTDLQCRSNMDCEVTEYCKITGYSYHIPRYSSCQTLDTPAKDMQVLNATGVGTKHMIRSQNGMYWDAAQNWCLAHGGRMASLTDFGITDCSPDKKDLENCGRASVEVGEAVGIKDLEGNWIDWMNNAGTGYYQTMVPQTVKDNWTELSTDYSWMKESYDANDMYLFIPSSGVVSRNLRHRSFSHSVLCVIDE